MMESNVKLSGEPSAQALASGLATLGRYGDNYMVHAAEGETFVPKEILDANPALKTQLFDQMKAMGIENPNRYVVGDALNSINPVTGQPEFFFKKIFKAVKKVFKKVLPIAAPIIGNIIAPGIGGLVASGLTAKLQGGSWGDALKAAGLSYAGGALMQGIGNIGNTASGGFTGGLTRGLASPFQAAQGLLGVGDNANPLKQGIFGGNYFEGKDLGTFKGVKDTLLPTYDKTGGVTSTPSQTITSENTITSPEKKYAARFLPKQENVNRLTGKDFQLNTSDLGTSNQNLLKQFNVQGEDFGRPLSFTDPLPQSNSVTGYPNVEVGDVSQAALKRAAEIQQKAMDKAYVDGKFIGKNFVSSDDALQQALVGSTAKPELSFLDKAKEALTSPKVLGSVLSAGIPAALTYAMSDDEELTEDQLSALTDPQRAAYDQFKAGRAANPNFAQTPEGQALLSRAGITSSRTAAQLARSTGVPLSQAEAFQKRRYGIVSAAGGGEIIGPGSGTSDSIPAMLSDGEFVMTAEAVRNAGNGDRDLGAARMYDMMNKFERAV